MGKANQYFTVITLIFSIISLFSHIVLSQSDSDYFSPSPSPSPYQPPSPVPVPESDFDYPPANGPTPAQTPDIAPTPSELGSPPTPLDFPYAPLPEQYANSPAPNGEEVAEEREEWGMGQQEREKSGRMSGGQKAGVALGVLVGAGVVGVAGFVYKKRQDNIRRANYGYGARSSMI